jgi:hypothetical protein
MAGQRKPNQIRKPALQEIFQQAFGSSGKSGTILLAQKWGFSPGLTISRRSYTTKQ